EEGGGDLHLTGCGGVDVRDGGALGVDRGADRGLAVAELDRAGGSGGGDVSGGPDRVAGDDLVLVDGQHHLGRLGGHVHGLCVGAGGVPVGVGGVERRGDGQLAGRGGGELGGGGAVVGYGDADSL